MVAAQKSSGITDLKQIRERKMPVRIMVGPSGGILQEVLDYYGITEKDVKAWGGQYYAGNALLKNPNFDLMLGLACCPIIPKAICGMRCRRRRTWCSFRFPRTCGRSSPRSTGP